MVRLRANLQGPAKEVVRMCKPQDFEDARGVERLLRILRESPLASMLVPDAYKKIQANDQIKRRPGEVIGDYIVSETPEVRNLEYDVMTIEPPLSTLLSALRLNTKWSKTKTRL